MGNSNNIQSSINQIFTGMDLEMLSKTGDQVFASYYEKTAFPEIAVFNQYRLASQIKKFSYDKKQKEDIKELMKAINNQSQINFEKKWEEIKTTHNTSS